MVSDSLSSTGGSGGDSTTASLLAYTKMMDECFPYYLALGMTEEQYWDKDCELVKAYRKADEIKRERTNQEMWWLSGYLYDVMCRVSPLYHDFVKKAPKPVPYLNEPYPMSKKQVKEREDRERKQEYEKTKAMMESFMQKHNKQTKGSERNVYDD